MTERVAPIRLCCVIPAYNEAENLPQFIPALSQMLSELTVADRPIEFGLIAVDDGSRDDTIPVLERLVSQYPLTVLQLSRNFGKEAALTAGIEAITADYDCALLIDADFQHPFSTIPAMLQLWQNGYDMIYGIRDRQTESPLKRRLTGHFYRLINAISEIDMPMDAGDFRLMDRKVVQALQQLPERTRYMKGLYAWVGFKSVGLQFEVQQREAGQSSFGGMALIRLAVTGLTAFSDMPLRLSIWVGATLSLLSIAYAIYEIIITLTVGTRVPGWPTLVVILTFLGGVQLLFIGILGEYISRIYSEVKARPTYIVSRRLKQSSTAELQPRD